MDVMEEGKARCREIRSRILDLAFRSGKNGSHLGGSLSAVEILDALYHSGYDFTPSFEQRDRMILSKGHAALAHYCVLESIGILTAEEADSFEKNGTSFFAHARRCVEKGIEFSGGSLGLGASFAVGVALACRAKGYDNRVFVLLGDGECDEGVVWESLMAAVHYHLDNLTFIIDSNGLQSDGYTKDVMNHAPLEERCKGFGAAVVTVDGHDQQALLSAFQERAVGVPSVIIARTVKGKGVSFMENQPSWHHGVLDWQQYEQALGEVLHG